MAYEFPRYLSKARATTDQPSAFAPESTEGAQLEQVGKVGQTAQNMTFKMAEAYQEARSTQAELNQRSQIDDLNARATADPDVNAYEKYRQENDKYRRDTVASLKNDKVAIAKADYYAKTADTQLQAIFRKKMIDNQQANLLGLLDKDAAVGDIDSIKSRIEINKNKGFIGESDAVKLEQKYIKQAKNNDFLADLNSDPETARANLSKNTYGFAPEDLEKAKKIQKSATNRRAEELKQAQMATVNQAGELLSKRELTSEQINDWVASGAMDAATGIAFELATVGPNDWDEGLKTDLDASKVRARANSFINPLKEMDGTDIDARQGIIKSALQNYNDKKLNINELSFILRVANGKTTEPGNPIWGYLGAAMKGVQKLTDPHKVIEKFQNRWDFQEDPREVMKQAAIDQFKEDRPETASYKLGDVIKRKNGSFEVAGFNDDGQPVFRKK